MLRHCKEVMISAKHNKHKIDLLNTKKITMYKKYLNIINYYKKVMKNC